MSDVNDVLIAQADLLDKMKRALSNFKRDGEDRKTKSYFVIKLESIAEYRKRFERNHNQILCSDLNVNDDYFKENSPDQFEEAYIEAFCQMSEKRDLKFPTCDLNATISSANNNENDTVGSSVRLPKLDVPQFSGKYTDWPAFYDTFLRLIHSNPVVSKVEKFHHLKQALPGNVDSDIRDLPLTANNYNIAWDTLVDRYNNKRVLFKHYMDLLLSLKIKSESSTEIKHVLDTSRACVNALKLSLDIPIDECDQMIVHFLVNKLPRESHQQWEQKLGNTTAIPSFKTFTEFLTLRYRTLESIESKTHSYDDAKSKPSSSTYTHTYASARSQPKQPPARSTHHIHHLSMNQTNSQPLPKCNLCAGDHIFRRCPTFLNMNSTDRKTQVEKLRLCLNCLSSTHFVAACPSARNCQTCGERHNTTIHIMNANNPTASPSVISTNHIVNAPQNLPTLSHATKFLSRANVLLPTAVVRAVAPDGSKFTIRIFIDDGSTGALISHRACQTLRLQYLPVNSRIDLPDGQCSTSKSAVKLQIHSRFNTSPTFDICATVVNSVTSDLPSRTLTYHDWPHIRGLDLADPEYHRSTPVDLLVGSDTLADILMEGLKKGTPNEPIARQTLFGWIISGRDFHSKPSPKPSTSNNNNNITANHIQCSHISLEQLDTLVKEFYALESVPTEQQHTTEEKWCRDYIHQTTVRQPNGKYMVRLPLKTIFDPELVIGRSRQMALNQFHSLERRLNANSDVREQYHQTIQEYFDLKQIESVTSTEDSHIKSTPNNQLSVTSYTLPHHSILKADSLTTKCRVVYNASSRSTNGKTLNDILCTGPRLQNDLPAVLLNWRLHEYVITADIGKMYRCIDLHPEDSEFHRMFWRDRAQQIKEFKLNTVTFGTASAPYTAIAILHRIADDEIQRFPLACNVLKKEMYVDDLYTGSHTIEHARNIRDQTQGALLSAGMKLHKWASNTPDLLDTIPVEHQSSSTALELNSSETLKTLGMRWQPNTDHFRYKVNFPIEIDNKIIVTKRTVLSTTAKLFDPLGLINPIIVVAKIFLKKLWAANLEWDDPLPSYLLNEWFEILASFSAINDIKIPRWLHYTPAIKRIQLHAFSDGSKHAYASIVYMRVEDTNNQMFTTIITAKSKVTPANTISIPRIELCGAVISIKLVQWVLKHIALDPNNIDIHYWTDATIVLSWIRGDINRWPIFVANRIGQIHTHSHVHQWHHVSTADNPADISSRGATAEELIASKLYWHGPSWLCESPNKWPISDWSTIDNEIVEHQVNTIVDTTEIPFTHRYSSLIKSQRIVGWILRFIHNCKTPKEFRRSGPLTASEIQVSLFKLVRLTQHESFASELRQLSRNEPVSHKSTMVSLTPFIDAYGIIRVRGRLQNAPISYAQKHPMILPTNHPFTNLLIDHAHIVTLHGGCQLTSAVLRKRFWIIHHKKVITAKIKDCMNCYKQKPPICHQLMGNLPTARVNASVRAFAAVGIDYAGPIELKASRFRGSTTYKGYIAIFICMAVKAIHLEAVTGLSTDHFMSALYRFMGRRSMPHDIYSDNGTNFIGAEKCLRHIADQFQQSLQENVIPTLADKGIQWHFIPPSSPNFGGLWEANVKAVKYHLCRTFNGTPLTFEDLSTALTRIESSLNSRPLCPLSADTDDLLVLTPGHFLVFDSLLAPPEPADMDLSLAARFSTVQRLAKSCWSRLKSDWLSNLQSRPKWAREEENLQINDLVLIKDDRLPSNQWARGRIIEIHPGDDQLVRVVTVRTADGTYRRCVSKISKLPIQQSHSIAKDIEKSTDIHQFPVYNISSVQTA